MRAIKEDASLRKGINTFNGKCTYQPVAQAFNLPHTSIEEIF